MGTLGTIVTLVSDTLRGERMLWVALAPGGLVLLVALWAWRWLRGRRLADVSAPGQATSTARREGSPARTESGARIRSSEDLSLFVENRRRRPA